MDEFLKLLVILGLFFAIAFADKKINLEDIERDNLRAESKSDSDNTRNEENPHDSSVQPETNQSKYQQENPQYDEEAFRYVNPQQLQDKYTLSSDNYQHEKYLEKNGDYEETPQSMQYADYQQQPETAAPKIFSQASNYETPRQQFYYQPEIPVGNRYETNHQKITSDKNSNRETLYVNIPMAQLLSYYPNIALGNSMMSKPQVHPFLHQITSQSDQQIAIPVYTPSFSREPVYSNSKIAYNIQPQYASQQSRYPQITEAILPARTPNKFIYSPGFAGRQDPRMHYLQEIIYSQQQPGASSYVPEISSSHETSVYDRPSSSHLESNKLSQNYASQTRNQQSYTPYDHQSMTSYAITGNYAPRLTNQIYQEQKTENSQQDFENVPETPESELDLPRLPAQNFKSSGPTRLSEITDENEDPHYSQARLIHSTEPKSLLDSYIPSNLLAAQNSERYRERPIKLERGFIPSKINYVHSYKKRGTE